MKRILVLAMILYNVSCDNNKRNSSSSTFQEQSIDEFKKRKSGFDMIFVEGGEFIMGGNDDVDDGGALELRLADECPHSVTLKSYQIGKYEVTQTDWVEIMGIPPDVLEPCEDCPVSQVSWNDIQVFIKKLNSKYNEEYRLPTEEEWEFASRGGLRSKGFMYSGSNQVNEVAWYSGNSENRSHPVGLLKPNELGIYDMSGNIWEWCSNYKWPYPCDTLGKKFDSRVLRGGTFGSRSSSVRIIDRNGRASSTKLPTLGFRLAK